MPVGQLASKARWLLLSDVHFKVHDLDRVVQTSQWIASLPQRYNIQRAIICGDLLTSRTTQPTHVLSACYRFLGQLSDQVPHLNVILGNHDLAYKREYTTTALDALDMRRLSKHITLHSAVSQQIWDGRRVLVLPFREDQRELTAAVAGLPAQDAAETVAFAHLAIHKAVLQRYAVDQVTGERRPCPAYKGLTGPGEFRRLARTFTGHFHSRQTIVQSPQDKLPVEDEAGRLPGSVTYLGAPLQMTWADLYDTQRGVTLLDPETLDQELLVNPHAVGFVTADLHDVLQDRVDAAAVADKHVMLLGERTQVQHVVARDKLLLLGARGVRNWNPIRASHQQYGGPMIPHGLGATASPGDARVEARAETQLKMPPPKKDPTPQETATEEFQPLDFAQLLEAYSVNLQLPKPLEDRRAELIHVGRCLVRKASGPENGNSKISYTDILDVSQSARESNDVSSVQHRAEPGMSRIFVAKLDSLSLTNFLGVRETLAIDFHKLPHALTFITGANGSGKSTLLEAIVWCQFGRCVRAGLAVNDVVNDATGRGCEVTLTFENGYSITRYRKHKEHGNRVVVSLHGVPQLEYEKGDARSTQEAIEDLLGTDYDTYVRTVILGPESAVGFLSSTALQRRDLIESMLGLGRLEAQRDLTRQMIREIDSEQAELQTKQKGLKQVMDHIDGTIKTLKGEHSAAVLQIAKITRTIEKEQATRLEQEPRREQERRMLAKREADPEEGSYIEGKLHDLEERIKVVRHYLHTIKPTIRETDIVAAFRRERLVHERAQQKAELEISEADVAVERHRLLRPGASWWGTTLGSVRKRLQPFLKHTKTRVYESAHHTAWSWYVSYLVQCLLRPVEVLERGLGMLESRTGNNNQALKPWYATYQDLLAKTTDAQRNHDMANIKWRKAAKTVAKRFGIPKRRVHRADRITADEVRVFRERHAYSTSQLNELTAQKEEWAKKQAKHQRQRDEDLRRKREQEAAQAKSDRMYEAMISDLQRSRESKREVAAVYSQRIAAEQASRGDLAAKSAALGAAAEKRDQARELFAFWDAAFNKPRSSTATASSQGTTNATMTNFRAYVLEQSLGEVNTVATEILASLYQDTRHARDTAEGMLKHIFASTLGGNNEESPASSSSDQDDNDDGGREEKKGSSKKKKKEEESTVPASRLLDSTSLGVTPALAYAKRSGGERKRIDLALFFALALVGQGRGAHRARYLLVDEVFDSLDPAGQAAVARWCRYLLGRVDFVAVVTHSEILPRLAGGGAEGGDDGGAPGLVVWRARMGEGGTVLEKDQ
ncbi:P-loop containing nucleoside triphosphate hydrolase protein [Apiospora marii]|uniref:P-loop containing nucleoside triphosphate hydrolase protein n=1 Tax=Apiospora marii TaxID=335849 RepID=A0ABR1RIK3_9PEZI